MTEEEIKQYRHEWYLRNKQLTIDRAKVWKKGNPTKVKASARKYAIANHDKREKWRKEWRKHNHERERILNLIRLSKRNKIRRKTDAHFKVKELLRGRLNRSLRLFKDGGVHKFASTEKLLGCTFSQFVTHIQSQWLPGMTWANHGLHGWHIDHIRQICEFDLSIPEHQVACFSYKNMQPLWAVDNLAKRFL